MLKKLLFLLLLTGCGQDEFRSIRIIHIDCNNYKGEERASCLRCKDGALVKDCNKLLNPNPKI